MDDTQRKLDKYGPQGASSLTKDGTPISLGPLSGYVGYALRRAQLTLFDHFTTLLRQFDLRPGQFSVLLVIQHNPGLRATDVCNALEIRKPNLVPVIRTLQRRGWVQCRASPLDRRTQTLELTARGRQLLARALRVHAEFEQRLIKGLGKSAARRLVSQLLQLAEHRIP
jgi:DNA-binding MarR family transcriptional regulator